MEEIPPQEMTQQERELERERELKQEREMLELEMNRRHRRRVVAIAGPALLGSLVLFQLVFTRGYFLDLMFGLDLEPQVLVVLMLFGAASLGLLMMYLQTGFERDRSAELASILYKMESRQYGKDRETATDMLVLDPDISTRISHLERRLDEATLSSHDITDAERTKLINRLQESIERVAEAGFIEKIQASVAESQGHLKFTAELQNLYARTTGRLNQELRALTLRGNLNLALGSVTAVIGILVLYFFVGDLEISPKDIVAFTSTFLPRLSLVILVEVFAYFFLRLYSTSLMEIKYFQNEITNVEAKFLALQTAIHRKDGKAVGEVISQIAQTERNYILQKGQTTVDLERSRIEKEAVTSLTRNLLRMFPRRS